MTLADTLAGVIAERGPLPAGTLATTVRKRKAVVLEALRSDSRFVRVGKTKATRWSVWEPHQRSFVADDLLALHPSWKRDDVAEIIFGAEGFLERGYVVSSLHGNGRVVVTERGLEFSAAVEQLREFLS